MYSNQNSNLNLLIQNPTVALEQILTDIEFLDQVRSGNPKLIDYITKHLSRILKFVTEEGNLQDRVRSVNIPMIVNSMFEQGNQKILNHFYHLTEYTQMEPAPSLPDGTP
jgi:hypothetical protein